MSFRRTWAQFRAARTTLGPTPGVREAWHQGRRWYHAWVLQIADEAVVARRDAVLAALDGVATPFSTRSPHVTVWVHGFDPPGFEHPLDGVELPLVVGRVNSFRSVPFLEVRSDLRAVRAAFPGLEERWAPYQPHLTVARYTGDVSVAAIVCRLRPWRRAEPIHTRGRLIHGVVDAWSEAGEVLPAAAAG